ncbi:hypothetical protein [Leuconostoc falkenbergense]|nr:hypothetical protein [Leuconostoc falkenbergense]
MFRLVATKNTDTDNFYLYFTLAALMLIMMIVAAVYYHFKNRR